MGDWKITPFLLGITSAVLFSHAELYRSSVIPPQEKAVEDASVFLRRAYHSSAVLSRRVYIDGGELSYLQDGNVAYESEKSLLWIDLVEDWTNASVTLHSSSKPAGVPNLKDGGVWADRRHDVLYIGFAGSTPSFGSPAPPPRGLWSFTPDKTGTGFWENLNRTADDRFLGYPRPPKGYATSGHGYGFFIGIGGSPGSPASPTLPLSRLPTAPASLGDLIGGGKQHFGGLMTYHFSDKQLTVNSNAFIDGSIQEPGSPHGLEYVSHWGDRGILVSVGSQNQDLTDDNSLASFDKVLVYDIANQRWFQQETSGDIPQPRRDFCIAGAPSNNRTYDMLVYGGWDGRAGSTAVPFDSVYVLTLPGFFWVKAEYPPASPRRGLTCNAVGGSQILTIGGVDATQQDGDAKAGFDTRDPFTQGLAIFDLSTLEWKPSYKAKQSLQPPAAPIQAYYDANGRHPNPAFSSRALESLFARDDFSRDPSADDDPALVPGASRGGGHDADIAAIVGGALGGAIGIVLAAAAAEFVRRRRRDRHERRVRKALRELGQIEDDDEEGGRGDGNGDGDGDGDGTRVVAMLEEDGKGAVGRGAGGSGGGGKGGVPLYRGVVMSTSRGSAGSEGVVATKRGGGDGRMVVDGGVAELDGREVFELDGRELTVEMDAGGVNVKVNGDGNGGDERLAEPEPEIGTEARPAELEGSPVGFVTAQ